MEETKQSSSREAAECLRSVPAPHSLLISSALSNRAKRTIKRSGRRANSLDIRNDKSNGSGGGGLAGSRNITKPAPFKLKLER